jgi:hypothetical protein
MLLGLGFATQPVALAINGFWGALLFALAVTGGFALRGIRGAALGAEAVLALVALQGVWAIVAGNEPTTRAALARAGTTSGVSWRFAFTDEREAVMKIFPRPAGWDDHLIYLRVDLADLYLGDAGFRLEVNGVPLGEVSNRATPPEGGPGGIPSWTRPIPLDVLRGDPLVWAVLRPTRLDPRLSIAGDRDARIEPLGRYSTWLFDGMEWTRDQLAGQFAPRAPGTYRIWLLTGGTPPATS